MVAVTTPRAGQYFNVKRDGRYINAQIVRNAETIVYNRKRAESIEHTQHSASSAECPVAPESPSEW